MDGWSPWSGLAPPGQPCSLLITDHLPALTELGVSHWGFHGPPTLLPVTTLTLLYRNGFILSLSAASFMAASLPHTYDQGQRHDMCGWARGRVVPHRAALMHNEVPPARPPSPPGDLARGSSVALAFARHSGEAGGSSQSRRGGRRRSPQESRPPGDRAGSPSAVGLHVREGPGQHPGQSR